MISEEGTLRAKISWKLGPLQLTAKMGIPRESSWRKIKVLTTVNTWMIRKWNSFIVDIKNVLDLSKIYSLWNRICLPMMGTWIPSLVQEDSTCLGAAKPMSHNYWAWASEPMSHRYGTHVLQLLKPVLHSKRNHHSENPVYSNEE